jgi:hypothetical protein
VDEESFVALAKQNTAASSATATLPNAAPTVVSNASASPPNAAPTIISNTTPLIADPSIVTANQPALLSLSNTSLDSSVPINMMQNPNNSASASNNNSSLTFSAAMASNTLQTIIHAIPAQLLTMLQHRVYVPLSFFLVKNMEQIRLERDTKLFKSLTKPIRVIDTCNFIDEKKLMFMQFNQAYHNFLKCLDLCCEPGSGIMEGWKDHFECTVCNLNMEDKFKVYLYMDILMRQQLMV